MYLAALLLKTGGMMNRQFFSDRKAAEIFVSNAWLPPYALAWWIEVYDSEGRQVESKSGTYLRTAGPR